MLSSFPTKGPLFLIDKKVCKFRNLNSALNFVLKERAGEGIGSITSRYIFIWLMPFLRVAISWETVLQGC